MKIEEDAETEEEMWTMKNYLSTFNIFFIRGIENNCSTPVKTIAPIELLKTYKNNNIFKLIDK